MPTIPAAACHFKKNLADLKASLVAMSSQALDGIGTFKQLKFTAFATDNRYIGFRRCGHKSIAGCYSSCPALRDQPVKRPIYLRRRDRSDHLGYLIGTNGLNAFDQDCPYLLVDAECFPPRHD